MASPRLFFNAHSKNLNVEAAASLGFLFNAPSKNLTVKVAPKTNFNAPLKNSRASSYFAFDYTRHKIKGQEANSVQESLTLPCVNLSLRGRAGWESSHHNCWYPRVVAVVGHL
jgi:hypothetical protein